MKRLQQKKYLSKNSLNDKIDNLSWEHSDVY